MTKPTTNTEILKEFEEEIEALKTELGEIPKNTCPDIDKAIEEVGGWEKDISYLEKNLSRYDTVEEIMGDFPNLGWADTPDILEKLRKDNEKLRQLGKKWYQQAVSNSFLQQALEKKDKEKEEAIKLRDIEKEVDLQKAIDKAYEEGKKQKRMRVRKIIENYRNAHLVHGQNKVAEMLTEIEIEILQDTPND